MSEEGMELRSISEQKNKSIAQMHSEYKQLSKRHFAKYENDRGIVVSTNPYEARIQRISRVLIAICKVMGLIIDVFAICQLLCIGALLLMGNNPRVIDSVQKYHIFAKDMRLLAWIPGSDPAMIVNKLMITHFIMLIIFLGLGWVIWQLYGMLLNVAMSGNPFTKNAIRQLHRMCVPLLLLTFWNVPISLCLVLFILFISFIFDYGIYLREKADETNMVQEDVILSFAEITEAKSGQTGQHVKRVSEYTKLLAQEMGFDNEKVEELRVASMMHDVGKLLIPSAILDKPGKLTDEEFEIIKKHTEYGEQLLENAHGDIMNTSRIVARDHHEKWDGNGYKHAQGEDISIEGRIVAVADVYDALTSRRSYKDAWEENEAYEEIVKCSGTHFDPKVVEAFKSCYSRIQEVRKMYADA